MIELGNVLPVPLAETPGGIRKDSQIFGTHCVFEKNKNYLVIAPSGRGKSTLLHIIYGLRKDYTGSVELEGKSLKQFSPNDWAATRQAPLSIVFQDLRLFPKLTALENILLKSRLTDTVTEQEILDWAGRLGVEKNLQQTAATLSYGQRQRIAIIRSLCQPFRYLLLDEPFSHLDGKNISQASALISEICRQREAGFILVSLEEEKVMNFEEVFIL